MDKTCMQRMNEMNVEAAEILLEEMKAAKKEGKYLIVKDLANAIAELKIGAEPVDFTSEMAKMLTHINALENRKEEGKVS